MELISIIATVIIICIPVIGICLALLCVSVCLITAIIVERMKSKSAVMHEVEVESTMNQSVNRAKSRRNIHKSQSSKANLIAGVGDVGSAGGKNGDDAGVTPEETIVYKSDIVSPRKEEPFSKKSSTNIIDQDTTIGITSLKIVSQEDKAQFQSSTQSPRSARSTKSTKSTISTKNPTSPRVQNGVLSRQGSIASAIPPTERTNSQVSIKKSKSTSSSSSSSDSDNE